MLEGVTTGEWQGLGLIRSGNFPVFKLNSARGENLFLTDILKWGQGGGVAGTESS